MEGQSVTIRSLAGLEEAQWCAQLLANSEPWTTRERDYQTSFSIFTNPAIEKFIAWHGNDAAGFILVVMNGVFTGFV